MSQKTIKAGPGVKKVRKQAEKERRRGSLGGHTLPPNALTDQIKVGFHAEVTAGPAMLIPYVEGAHVRQLLRSFGQAKDQSLTEGDSAVQPCVQAVAFLLSQFHGADASAIAADLEKVKKALVDLSFDVKPVEEDEDGTETGSPEVGEADAADSGD